MGYGVAAHGFELWVWGRRLCWGSWGGYLAGIGGLQKGGTKVGRIRDPLYKGS